MGMGTRGVGVGRVNKVAREGVWMFGEGEWKVRGA